MDDKPNSYKNESITQLKPNSGWPQRVRTPQPDDSEHNIRRQPPKQMS